MYTESNSSHPIVLFDGVCNLCNTSVRFLLAYNHKANLKFAPLQSAKAKEILKHLNWDYKAMDSLILIEDDRVYIKSEAVFKVSQHLTYPWKAIYHFRYLPKGLCEWLYNLIAHNRYALFGKKQSCMIPKEEWKNRFI